MKHLLIAGAFVLTATAALAQYSFTSYPDYPAECSAIQNLQERRQCESTSGFRDEVRAVTAENRAMCAAQPTSAQRNACLSEHRDFFTAQFAEWCAAGLQDDNCGN